MKIQNLNDKKQWITPAFLNLNGEETAAGTTPGFCEAVHSTRSMTASVAS